MTNGAVLIAHNSNRIDYVKQAVYSASRIKKYLNIPVSIITGNSAYLKENFDYTVFDKIIETDSSKTENSRFMTNEQGHKSVFQWNNLDRCTVYDLSPYDKTLLLDTDYIVTNSLLSVCFESKDDFLIYKDAVDLTKDNNREFKFISETSVDFYWATVVYFEKNDKNKIFFDLVKHIQDEWQHYRMLYQISSSTFRNDFAFSIAIHIMNGHQQGEFAKSLPGKLYFVSDSTVLAGIKDNQLKVLVKDAGNYNIIKTKELNVHVMNKLSLEKIIDEENANV